MLLSVKEHENKTLLPVSQRENVSHNDTQERVFKSVQLKPGLLPIKLRLISLMLMLTDEVFRKNVSLCRKKEAGFWSSLCWFYIRFPSQLLSLLSDCSLSLKQFI